MMKPLPERIERLALDDAEIDSKRAEVLPDIVASVKARLARGERRPVVYPPRPLPPVRPQQPPPTLREIAMAHPAVLTSEPVAPPLAKPVPAWLVRPEPPPEPLVDIDMSLPAARRVRQALAAGKRSTRGIMEITGATRATVLTERWALLRRTGEKLPPRDGFNPRIRACIANGMTDAREIQEVSGATRRNHIHRLLKEARAKADG